VPLPFLAQLAWGVALQVVGFLLAPKPKQPKPPSVSDVEDPTADAGRPIPVVFGSVTITGVNNLGFWDKQIATRKVKVKKK
jgi:hypothetical protein